MSAAPDIFLSYNREDAEIARRFAQGFEAQGFDVWWDQALRSGDAYDEVTEAALRGARAVVVLWSPRSVVSRWVRAEASIADEIGSLAPVMIEPCDLPVMFRLTQTSDLSGWQGAADNGAWRAFLDDVRRMVGTEAPASAAKPDAAPAPADSGIPVVAVLPITFRGSGEELEFLAEDLTEELTRELPRSSRFKVIAAGIMAAWRGKQIDYRELGRELGTRYLAEGKLQRSGENVRLTMQLIDTSTGDMPWSKRFVRTIDEVEDSPEELSGTISAELFEQIISIEVSRSMTKSGPYSGWEHCMRSYAYHTVPGSDSTRRMVEEARLAIAAAPDLGRAHAALAIGLAVGVVIEGEELDDARSREIRKHITRTMQLDGQNPRVLSMLILPYAALGDPEASLQLARRLVELLPGSPLSFAYLGFANMHVGRAGDAIAAYEHQNSLSPFNRVQYAAHSQIGICHLLEGRLEEAKDALDRSLALNPDYHVALKWKAIVAARLGKEEFALATINRLREAEPAKTIDQHARQMLSYSSLRDRMAEPVATLRRLWDATEGEE